MMLVFLQRRSHLLEIGIPIVNLGDGAERAAPGQVIEQSVGDMGRRADRCMNCREGSAEIVQRPIRDT